LIKSLWGPRIALEEVYSLPFLQDSRTVGFVYYTVKLRVNLSLSNLLKQRINTLQLSMRKCKTCEPISKTIYKSTHNRLRATWHRYRI